MKKTIFAALGIRQINRILTKKKNSRLNGEFNAPWQKFFPNIHQVNQ